VFNFLSFVFNGNNARSSLIIYELSLGKIKLLNHLYFYTFKLLKTIILVSLYIGFSFHGKEIISGMDWIHTMRVISFL
jgi:hypothetical protein